MQFLGSDAAAVAASEDPFSGWSPKRVLDEDLPEPEVTYDFEEHGVAFRCDANERIESIFVTNDALVELDFSLSTEEVRRELGTPSATGGPVDDPVLGASGAWDLFPLGDGTVHVQYRVDGSGIEVVTFMRPDVVPVTDDHLIITPVRSLVATLLNREEAKGSPLSEEEVRAITQNAPSIAMPEAARSAVDEERGYLDIDPENAWEEWQVVRSQFTEPREQ